MLIANSKRKIMIMINLDRMRLGGSFGSSTSSTSALRPYLSYADTSLQLFNQVRELLNNLFKSWPVSFYNYQISDDLV